MRECSGWKVTRWTVGSCGGWGLPSTAPEPVSVLLWLPSHTYPLPLPPPCTPVHNERGVGVPPPCVHLSPGLEAGAHEEEVEVWPGKTSEDLLEWGKGEYLLSPTDFLYLWLSGSQRTKRRPRRAWANGTQRRSRQDGPVWPPSKCWVGPGEVVR